MSRLIAKVLPLIGVALLVSHAAADEWQRVASTDKNTCPTGAHLTLAQALHLAEVEASKHHIDFSDFLEPSFEYSHDNNQGYTWAFIYDGKVPAPGNHFMVVVNDRTQHADFVPGM
jgi:hypothetical protein